MAQRRKRSSNLATKVLVGVGAGTFLALMYSAFKPGAALAARRRGSINPGLDSVGAADEDDEDGGPVEHAGAGTSTRLLDLTPAAPADLVLVGKVYLAKPAAAALLRLIEAARSDGIPAPLLTAVSGFRSPVKQEKLWQRALTKYRQVLVTAGKNPTQEEVEALARRWVAPPGNSTHQTGRAVDLELGYKIASESASKARSSEAWKWLTDNAKRFGFVPYLPEPWHWEYLG